MRISPKIATRGVSLVLTLVVMVALVLILVVVARMVMVEKRVSRGYSEIARAEMAADAGSADAQQLLLNLFTKHPDSCTYWEPQIANTATPGTVFLFRNPALGDPNAPASGATVWMRPLVSAAVEKELYPNDKSAETLPPGAIDAKHSIDINAANGFGGEDPNGWVGALPPANASPPAPLAIRVPWVEIKDDKNAVVARYAFWVDDESFKLNLNTMKAAERSDASSEKDEKGKSAPKPSLRGIFLADSVPDLATAESVERARDGIEATKGRFLTPFQIGHSEAIPAGLTPGEFGPRYKFILTTESSGLDVSRAGFKRISVNEIVRKDAPTTPSDAPAKDKLRKGIYQIAAAINANAPQFGQRFYRSTSNTKLLSATSSPADAADKNETGVVSAADQQRYLLKLATNIFDFISPSANPTVIDASGTIVAGEPINSLQDLGFSMDETPGEETNPIAAIGKKNIPYLTEYVWSVRTLTSDVKPESNPHPPTAATYEFVIDHYFEFWNMSDREIHPDRGDLGPEPYLVLENQPYITTNASGDKSTHDVGVGRAFKIKLDEDFMVGGSPRKLVFKPDEPTIITTDPDYADYFPQNNLSGKTVYVPTALYDPVTGERVDQGVSAFPFADPLSPPVRVSNVRRYRVDSYDFRPGGNWAEVQIAPDQVGAASTKLILGNKFGLLDAAPSLALHKYQNRNTFNVRSAPGMTDPFSGSQVAAVTSDNRGGWDPRGKLDPLTIRIQQDYSEGVCSTLALAPPNLGDLNFMGASSNLLWTSDLINLLGAKVALDPENPTAVCAAGPLLSVAELGHVYDPALVPQLNSSERTIRRTGGRTLAIGQPDAYWDGTRNSTQSQPELAFQTSASREWTAWRLADIFSIRSDDDRRGDSKVEVEGLYNPNGILRDGGLALRALLEGVQFSPSKKSDPQLGGEKLNTSGTEKATQGVTGTLIQSAADGGPALARYLAQRLSRAVAKRFSPLWEPGEISQLQMFSPFSQTSTSSREQIKSGANVEKLNDRGREELSHRLVDLLTPKGNTYSIYVVGQTLDKRGKPIAICARRVIVRLTPVWTPALDDDFDPEDGGEVKKRFRRPDSWTLKIVNIQNA